MHLPQHEPLLPEVGVLALVPDEWGTWWQPRHQVLVRLARYFRVLWVEPQNHWRQVLVALKSPPKRETEAALPPGFRIFRQTLPEVYRSRPINGWLRRQSLLRAANILRRSGCKKLILYLWRPEFQFALKDVPSDVSCYHIDDEYSFSSADLPTSQTESALIGSVDQVFIHSPALLEKKGRINPKTLHVPNGVDYDFYSRPRILPEDLARIPWPRVGYAGWIKSQLDLSLLVELARNHSGLSFVFVGGLMHEEIIGEDVRKLAALPNVSFLGAKSTEDMANYPPHFDVCIMPYKLDGYTRYIYPLKLHEYLATGRPTVGTGIRSLQDFRKIVTLADTYDEWVAALREGLSSEANTEERRAARQSVAQQHDWTVLVHRIAHVLAARLGEDWQKHHQQFPSVEAGTVSRSPCG